MFFTQKKTKQCNVQLISKNHYNSSKPRNVSISSVASNQSNATTMGFVGGGGMILHGYHKDNNNNNNNNQSTSNSLQMPRNRDGVETNKKIRFCLYFCLCFFFFFFLLFLRPENEIYTQYVHFIKAEKKNK